MGNGGSLYVYVVLILFVVCSITAKESEKWVKEKIEKVHVGNFALPTSQQPGPLIGFGQNIVDKGELQLFAYGDQLKGKRKSFAEIAPSLLYGITDKFSLFIEQSVAVKFKNEQFTSHGLEDLLVQFEGVVYAQETTVTVNEITLVGNMTLPTGSATKQPPTGFGAPTFFLGFTVSRTKLDWYYFSAMGGIITTSHHQTKFGKEFLYQFGVSKNIVYKADRWIFNWMVELDGLYRQNNRIRGIVDRSSGGNTIVLGPSLWFSTQRLILQGGISAVVADHPFGMQTKNNYFAAANVGWKF